MVRLTQEQFEAMAVRAHDWWNNICKDEAKSTCSVWLLHAMFAKWEIERRETEKAAAGVGDGNG